jgi:branched-chain amino acid transport system permease protein
MLAYPIVGGMTSIWGGLTGGAVFRILPELLRPVADYLDLIFAVLVILITMFLPGGLIDLIRRPFAHLRRPATQSKSDAAAIAATPAIASVQAIPAQVPALKISDVSRRFGALQAVDDVTLAIQPGAIHGVIGPNGAGKTSLFNIVSGFLEADSGDIEIFGQKALGLPAKSRIALGMTRTFQHVALFPQLSCLDNVVAGIGRNTVMQSLADSFDEVVNGARSQEHRERALSALASVGLADIAHLPAGQQSLGNQRRLEIARAIVSRPRLILLDEPVSGVSKDEAGRLRDLLLRINAETGVTMLLIEHNIGFVTDLCRTVSVMGNGRIVAEGEAHATVALPAVRRLYFGERDAA